MAPPSSRAEALLDALPQTQCRRCGYADCRAYAQAIAGGDADVNRCPPGGAEGVARLAAIMGLPVVALAAECGAEVPRALAVIDEATCIGCALCLAACPTDAIVGAAKRMHTVIETLCTGCELCLPVCPVDCIGLLETSGGRSGWAAWSEGQANVARHRYASHQERRGGDGREVAPIPAPEAAAMRQQAVAAALARARATQAR